MNHFAIPLRLLRDRQRFFHEVRAQTKLETKIVSLLVASSAFFALYGAIMGAYSGGWQVLSSAIKLPALYLITLIICLPPLYFFDLLLGSKLGFKQYVAMGLAAIAVIGLLLLGFIPMMLFFLSSVRDYNFFLLLNVLVMAVTGAVGVKLFYTGMRGPAGPLPVENSARHRLLEVWVVLYGAIGSQLGWTLSPFVGLRGEPIQIFRADIDGNFYLEVMRALAALLGQ